MLNKLNKKPQHVSFLLPLYQEIRNPRPKIVSMSTMTAVYPAVIYFRNRSYEYYKIDLGSLPERLRPIANFNLEDLPGWTVIDECIYCIGGRKKVKGTIRHTVGMNFNKYDTANPSSTWDPISPTRNLRLYMPSVFAFDRKIYVFSGSPLVLDHFKSEGNADPTYWGEYYDLDSQTWSYLPKVTIIECERLPAFHVAVDKKTIVFHSVCSNDLLVYNVEKEQWIRERHPNLQLADIVVREGLEKCDCLYALFYVAYNMPAVACNSTLYWLNNDLCLYGYDYRQKRWVQSNSLETQLDWPLLGCGEDILYMPLLFYLDDKTFVAICNASLEELGVAIIGVKRESHCIEVSLISYHIFPVDTSDFGFNLFNGMLIRKDQGSVLGKRKSASED